jgi:hypothetical protein
MLTLRHLLPAWVVHLVLVVIVAAGRTAGAAPDSEQVNSTERSAEAGGLVVYVAPEGNDAWSGRRQQPNACEPRPRAPSRSQFGWPLGISSLSRRCRSRPKIVRRRRR